MNKQKFQSEMRRAEALRKNSDSEMVDYWAGYIRGLRRAHHGDNFGNPGEHEKWLGLDDVRGEGYRNGLKFVELFSTMGRPSIGSEMLPAITVSEDIKTALAEKAERLGLSIPDARRKAYKKFINS